MNLGNPPIPPTVLELNYWKTSVQLDLLLPLLTVCCFHLSTEADVDISTYTFHCKRYFKKIDEIEFDIHLYSYDGGYIIEFQHHVGDRVGFIDAVKGFFYYMKKTAILPSDSEDDPSHESYLLHDEALVTEAVNRRLQQIKTHCLEEAFIELVKMRDTENALAAATHLEEWIVYLQHENPMIQRCALILLNRIISRRKQEQIIVKIADIVSNIVLSTDNIILLQEGCIFFSLVKSKPSDSVMERFLSKRETCAIISECIGRITNV